MGREIRRVPPDYKGLEDRRNKWDEVYGESCTSPTGTGYQMWQDTGPDSPISPVFATEDEMVAWLVAGQPVGFGGDTWRPTEEVARNFIRVGWAFGFALVPGRGYVDGLDIMGERKP